ncbi:MAG: hypothetical protein WCS98_06540 [Bacillota bacterium]|nr:ferrochelatase [Bacillota bacterium]MDD3850213.1 ferrochelatase [Bacillota bacterium]
MKIELRSEALSLILIGLLTGIFAAAAMMLHGIWHIVTIALLCICFFVFVFLIKKRQKKLRAVLIFVGATVLGYLLYCVLICAFPGRINVGEISPSDRKDEAAILLLSPGEITEYQYKSALYRLDINRQSGVEGVKWWNTPVKALQLRKNIKRIDEYKCLQAGENLYNKLNEELKGDFGLYSANLFGPPFIETVVGDMLKDGYNKIIVLNNLLVEQPYKEVVDEKILRIIEKSGMDAEVLFTFPLWNHDALVSYYEQSILEKTQEISPEQVGVVLVARGTGKKVREKYPQTVNHEQVFYDKIKESIMKNGYESRKIRIAYLRHRQLGIGDAVEYLLDSGISKLVIVTAGFENSGIDTEWLLPKFLGRIDVPEHIDTVIIGPWGDSDLLVRALMDRLDMVDVL